MLCTTFVLLFVEGLNATFECFEQKLSSKRDTKEHLRLFECKYIIMFALNIWENCHL